MITAERLESIRAHAARHEAEGFVDNDVSLLLAERTTYLDANANLATRLALAESSAPDIYDAAVREQQKRRALEHAMASTAQQMKDCVTRCDRLERDTADERSRRIATRDVADQLHQVVKEINERVRTAMENMIKHGLAEDAPARFEAALHLAHLKDALDAYETIR